MRMRLPVYPSLSGEVWEFGWANSTTGSSCTCWSVLCCLLRCVQQSLSPWAFCCLINSDEFNSNVCRKYSASQTALRVELPWLHDAPIVVGVAAAPVVTQGCWLFLCWVVSLYSRCLGGLYKLVSSLWGCAAGEGLKQQVPVLASCYKCCCCRCC